MGASPWSPRPYFKLDSRRRRQCAFQDLRAGRGVNVRAWCFRGQSSEGCKVNVIGNSNPCPRFTVTHTQCTLALLALPVWYAHRGNSIVRLSSGTINLQLCLIEGVRTKMKLDCNFTALLSKRRCTSKHGLAGALAKHAALV